MVQKNEIKRINDVLVEGIRTRAHDSTLNELLGLPGDEEGSLYERLGAFTATENLKAILGDLSTTKNLGGILGAFDTTENLKAILGDLSTSKRLGQILGALTETDNLKAILGAYTAAAPLKADVDSILADTTQIADGSLPADPAAGSLARFIASGGTALGTPLPASKSLYDVIALDRLDKQHAGTHKTYPLLADPVTLTSSASAWTYGSYAEIVPADTITSDFWITGIEASNPSAADNYVICIATGGAGAETDIIEVPVTRTDITAAGVIMSVIIPVNPPVKVSANTRISGRSASKAANANTIDVKILYATGLR